MIEQFESDGYVFLRGFIDSRTVANVQAELTALVDQEAEKLIRSGKISDRFENEPFEARLFRLYESHIDEAPGGYRPELHLPGFFDVFFNPRILDIVEVILGPEIRLYPNYTVRPKLADQIQTLVLWHQDGGYTDRWHKTQSGEVTELRMVNVWTPLVPARVENGCMQFIPGSHKHGLFTHEQRQHFLEVPSAELTPHLERTVDVELDVGDVVLFSNMLLHRGLPNRTKTVRWNIDWRYQDATQSTLRDTQGHIARSERDSRTMVKSASQWASLQFQ
jgi:phytanoyl-CoA hydroxylase